VVAARSASFVAPGHPAFSPKTAPLVVSKQALTPAWRRWSAAPLLLLLLIQFWFAPATFAQSSLSGRMTDEARAERIYFQARARLAHATNSPEAAWQFARACFDWAEFATGNAPRAQIAIEGIAACRHAIALNPNLAAPYYYLGLNLGQLARTKKLGALKLVEEMETNFKAAIALDPAFDYAGAHRSLGLLYLNAPGWPASIGSRAKARQHLQKAVELCPEYPDNRLSLLEAYLEWSEKKAAVAGLQAMEETLEAARKKFTGEAWASSWRDWEARWQKIKLKALTASPPLETPRNRK